MVNRSHMLSQKRPSFNKNSPQKKKRENKRKNTVSVSVQRIYLGTFCQIPKIPRSTRMVAWLCWSLQANHESKDRGSLSLATSGVCFWCLEGWRLLLESSPHKLCFFPKRFCGFCPPKLPKLSKMSKLIGENLEFGTLEMSFLVTIHPWIQLEMDYDSPVQLRLFHVWL